MVRQLHETLLSGHLGVKKTKEIVGQRFYWYKIKKNVKLTIKKCNICASDKLGTKKPKAPLGGLRAGAPWDTLAIDYMGPFPETERGNRYILVMTNHFT